MVIHLRDQRHLSAGDTISGPGDRERRRRQRPRL